MEKNVIFRKFEVIGTTKDEAKAQTTLNLRVDATQSYKKWAEKNAVTPEKQVEWMKQYLHDKKFDMPNDGAFIVIQSAVRDTRERPYQIEDIKHDAKTHSPEHFYVLRDDAGNEVGREKTKQAAKDAAKKFITAEKRSVKAFHEWNPKEKNALAFVGKYTPSKGQQDCKLLVFGFEVVD